MNATILESLPTITEIEPSQATMFVAVNPAALSNDCLLALRMVSEPKGREGDDFRAWLRECVLRENGRRLANDDATDGVPMEAEALTMPWHTWNDQELCAALAASYTWTGMRTTEEIDSVFSEIHCSVVTVCCTRLRELHDAIENSRRKRG